MYTSLIRILTILFGFLSFTSACDIKNNHIEPYERFARIYDTGEPNRSYYAVDIAATADSGYLVLGAAETDFSDFYALYLLKINKAGLPEWQYRADERFVHPLGIFQDNSGQLRVVCMDATTLNPLVLNASPAPTVLESYPDMEYPLAFTLLNNGERMFLCYDRIARSSIVASSANRRFSFPVYEDVENILFQHMSRRGQYYPFQIGQIHSDQLFFNGFNNYTLALTFLRNSDGSQLGVVNGTRYEAGISACLAMEGNRFAIARYQEDGKNFFNPLANITTNAVSSASHTGGYLMQELMAKSSVKILRLQTNVADVLLYLSTTQNGQIVLHAYDAEAGQLLGSRYFGHGNRFEAASLAPTPDGGLVVLGRMWMAGRFARLCVFKLNRADLHRLINS